MSIRNALGWMAALTLAVAPAARAEERDPEATPRGTQEDRSLWSATRDATNAVYVVLHEVGESSYRLRFGGYYEALDGSAAASPGTADEARALKARLLDEVAKLNAALPPPGSVTQHACRYTMLYLGQSMEAGEASAPAKRLPEMRKKAGTCVRELTAQHRAIEPLARRLWRTLADVDAWLGRPGVEVPEDTVRPSATFVPLPSQASLVGEGARDSARPTGAPSARPTATVAEVPPSASTPP
jgi:hypothetical protein